MNRIKKDKQYVLSQQKYVFVGIDNNGMKYVTSTRVSEDQERFVKG